MLIRGIKLKKGYIQWYAIFQNFLKYRRSIFQDITKAKCFDNYLGWFREIVEDGIAKNEFIPEAINLANGLFVIGDGFFITNSCTNINKNLKEELNTFFDTLFKLIGVKK